MAAPAEKPVHPIVALQTQLQQRSDELRRALPQHIPVERFVRVVMTACQMNPDLLACDRQTLWNACLRAANDGLLPDGRDGAIVPYKDKAVWMPMVQGLLKRFRNSGQFKSITANVVLDGEPFEHWIDENGEHMKHIPTDQPGELVKAYAVATLLSGGTMIQVMSKADVEKRRRASRVPDGPMWKDWYEEAAKKTVLRNLAKYLPTSSDLDDLIRRDDALYDFGVQPQRPADVGEALDRFSAPSTLSNPKRPSEPNTESNPKTISEPEDARNPIGASEPLGNSNPKSPSEPESDSSPQQQSEPSQSSKPTAQSSSSETKAYDAGVAAKHKGISRKAVPPEYRTPEASHLAKAWWSGWDSV